MNSKVDTKTDSVGLSIRQWFNATWNYVSDNSEMTYKNFKIINKRIYYEDI